jgi:hypothetical protein
VNDGVQLNVPDVFEAFVVKVLPGVGGLLEDVSDVIASPSGSDAATVNERGLFSGMFTVPGAVTTGARSVFRMVSCIVVDELEAPSLAVIVAA